MISRKEFPVSFVAFLSSSGVSLGGASVWGMHFVGMQALSLHNPCNGSVLHIEFNNVLTLVSLVAAMIICAICLYVVLPDSDEAQQSVSQIQSALARQQSSIRILSYFGCQQLRYEGCYKRIAIGASVLTIGVCTMHYMGMAAQRGRFDMSINVWIVIASVLIAAVATTVGLLLTVQFYLGVTSLALRIGAAVVIGIAVNAMHYVGMHSASYIYTGEPATDPLRVSIDDTPSLLAAIFLVQILQLALCQHFSALLFARLKEINAARHAHIVALDHCREILNTGEELDFPLVLISLRDFQQLGRLFSHEELRDTNKLMFIDTLVEAQRFIESNWIAFMSHQWLAWTTPDPTEVHYRVMLAAAEQLAEDNDSGPDKIFLWVDYLSIPQKNRVMQKAAIGSLCAFSALSSFLVVVAPICQHQDEHIMCDFATYSRRMWCRCEFMAKMVCRNGMKNIYLASTQMLLSDPADRKLIQFTVLDDSDNDIRKSQGKADQISNSSVLDEMFFIYGEDAECTCCSLNHMVHGVKIPCDKDRLAWPAISMYGRVFLSDNSLQPRLRSFLLEKRHRIWPESYFKHLIPAMETACTTSSAQTRLGFNASIDDEESHLFNRRGHAAKHLHGPGEMIEFTSDSDNLLRAGMHALI